MRSVEIIVIVSRSDLIQKCDKYEVLGYGVYREDLGAPPHVELCVANSKVQSYGWEPLEMFFFRRWSAVGRSIEWSEEAQYSLPVILVCPTVSYQLIKVQRRSPLRSTIMQISINCEFVE
jgi:hypothetical protein